MHTLPWNQKYTENRYRTCKNHSVFGHIKNRNTLCDILKLVERPFHREKFRWILNNAHIRFKGRYQQPQNGNDNRQGYKQR